ncbi:hypothetical protein ARMGADRAFT_937708, partial [Armillaria gallica]
EEILIDFCELIGEHSGINMAAAVWETLQKYGSTRRIMTFIMDNATNNDTMIEEIEFRCQLEGINFSTQDSQLQCMPHTVHLTALKVPYLFLHDHEADICFVLAP